LFKNSEDYQVNAEIHITVTLTQGSHLEEFILRVLMNTKCGVIVTEIRKNTRYNSVYSNLISREFEGLYL
jgi:hypothetical protein